MSNNSTTVQLINKQVAKAGYYHIGHYDLGYIRLVFDDCEIKISPTCGKISDLLDDIFDIDCEDGAWFEGISGKYCRLKVVDGAVTAILHIINNSRIPVKELMKAYNG